MRNQIHSLMKAHGISAQPKETAKKDNDKASPSKKRIVTKTAKDVESDDDDDDDVKVTKVESDEDAEAKV